MRTALVVAGVVVGVLAVLGLGFVVMMRTRPRALIGPFLRMQRDRLNPRQLEGRAGTAGHWVSVVHHVGRMSGDAYRTPVGVVEVEDGLVIALPYGSGTDWVRNVMVAGAATIEHQGEMVPVDRPKVLPRATANPWFPPSAQRQHRLFGMDEFLLLHRA